MKSRIKKERVVEPVGGDVPDPELSAEAPAVIESAAPPPPPKAPRATAASKANGKPNAVKATTTVAEGILAAQHFIDAVGGIEAAQRALKPAVEFCESLGSLKECETALTAIAELLKANGHSR